MPALSKQNFMLALDHEVPKMTKLTNDAIKTHDNWLVNSIPLEAGEYGMSTGRRRKTWRFFGQSAAYTAVGPSAVDATTYQETLNGNCGPETITANGNEGESRLCDLPTTTVHAGADSFGHIRRAAAWETPIICLGDFVDNDDVQGYLDGLKRELPRVGVDAHEDDVAKQIWEKSKANFAITQSNSMHWGQGVVPHRPTGVASIQHLFLHSEDQKARGNAMPIYGVSNLLLRRMIEAHQASVNATTGATMMLKPFESVHKDFGKVFEYEGVTFKILDVPRRGTVRAAPGGWDFVPWDPRKFRAGTETGIYVEYDATHNSAWVTCNGQIEPLYEAIYFISPKAAIRRPVVLPPSPVTGAVNTTGRFGMEVSLVSGAYIPNNADGLKSYFRMTHAYEFMALYADQMGVILSRYAPPAIAHIAPPDPDILPETFNIRGPQIPEPPNNAPGDVEALAGTDGFNAEAERPIAPTADEPRPTNVAGFFYPQVTVTVSPSSNTVRIGVLRASGSVGAATLAFTTTEGTAVGFEATAPEDYTALSGTLSWATGEHGWKFTAPITINHLVGNTEGRTFSVDWATPTGAAFGSPSCHKTCVTITNAAGTSDAPCSVGTGVLI